MGFDSIFHYLNMTLEVFFVDLLLSGDNAMVIALACRSLSPDLAKRAMLIGVGGGVVLRILLTSVASLLLTIPLLKLAGGAALTAIAIKLTVEEGEEAESGNVLPRNSSFLWSAVGTIIVADLVMSVDNVVALAAVTQGNIIFLAAGLILSVSLLMYGSLFVSALLRRYPLLIRGGGALLGWIAGDIVISDPMFADWVNQQSPALTVAVPFLVAVFVLVESRIMEGAQAAALALRPKPRPKPVKANVQTEKIQQAPVASISTVVSQPAETEAPSPISRPATIEAPLSLSPAITIEMPRQIVSDTALPVDDSTKSKLQAAWTKRYAISVLIAIAITITLLWIVFRSLDFSG